jgi:hypothetical protein
MIEQSNSSSSTSDMLFNSAMVVSATLTNQPTNQPTNQVSIHPYRTTKYLSADARKSRARAGCESIAIANRRTILRLAFMVELSNDEFNKQRIRI